MLLMGKDKILSNYRNLEEEYDLLLQKEKRILFILSILRLFVFLGGLGFLWLSFNIGSLEGIFSLAILILVFGYLLFLFSDHTLKRDFYSNLITINKNELKALSGDISVFGNGEKYVNQSHDFSNDIDLFGNKSVFQFINRTCTGNGSDILAGWLSDPMKISENLHFRQEAIKELSENLTWYQKFIATGMLNPLNNSDISDLMDWMGEDDKSQKGFFHLLTIYILPVVISVILILVSAGLVHYSFFIILFLLNLAIIGSQLKRTNNIHNRVSGKYQFLSSTALLLRIFDKKPFSATLLTEMRNQLVGSPQSAEKSIKRLSRILQTFDSRLNMLVGFALNGLFLWDLQCINFLRKWKKDSKDSLPEWMNILGQADAFVSLAGFAYNNPQYTYPLVSVDQTVFKAVELGHPLIDEKNRVNNNFEIIQKGSVRIITGANMAGKSTFLRTVAVNFVLAMTGAPVCAGEMIFSPMKIFSSMRTTDSLSQNESYFYAELKRLKKLKNMLEEGEPVFFLLDEILKGTNSTDKSIGSKLFLKKVISLKGTGIIATHDISLGELETTYQDVVRNQCFEIEIDGEHISFDYKLKSGITQKMNAAILMKQMGITEEDIL